MKFYSSGGEKIPESSAVGSGDIRHMLRLDVSFRPDMNTNMCCGSYYMEIDLIPSLGDDTS
jgi:hypothetical protein